MAVVQLITSNDVSAELRAKVSQATLTMMLDGVSAAAYRAAPCLADSPTDEQLAEARLVALSALERWLTDGSGMSGRTQTAGPFHDTVTPPQTTRASGYRLWPSEIATLQAICRADGGLTSISLVSSQGARRGDRDWFDAGPP